MKEASSGGQNSSSMLTPNESLDQIIKEEQESRPVSKSGGPSGLSKGIKLGYFATLTKIMIEMA